MADVCNSVTVTEFPGKPGKWNAINPASEKPKFGRGTSRPEMKGAEAVRKDGDKWLPPGPQGSGTEHGLHDRRPGAERSAPFILFSAEAKKWNSKLELECRKFLIKKEGDSVPDSWGGNRLRIELENNSSLCYSEFVRQKPIQFTSV